MHPHYTDTAFQTPAYASPDQTSINMELDHPEYGWIPITINAAEYPILWSRATAGDVAPHKAPSADDLRTSWRQTASLTRDNFCLALHKHGILPLDQAVAAARGNWPDAFTPLLSAMPDGLDPAEAQIRWATATEIRRMHPLFEAVRRFHQMSAEDADVLFGWRTEPAGP